MRFLVDAQLPSTLKAWLSGQGYDTLHADDLPKRSRTSDIELADFSTADDRILISKDSDFLTLKILFEKPPRLLLITTGNIGNVELRALFERNFESICKLFETFEIVELNNNFVVGRNLD